MNTLSADHIRTIVRWYERSGRRGVVGRTDLKHSAVLVPLIFAGDEPALLLTRRTDRVETHKGQVAFPGGTVDDDDRDRTHTALRELEEELGIPASAVEICGMLDDLATPTGFVITPVVGILHGPPEVRCSEEEVDEVFQVPLSFFADPAYGERELRQVGGERREIWIYTYNGRTIWGATAAVIRNLLAVLTMPSPDFLEESGHRPRTPSGGRIP